MMASTDDVCTRSRDTALESLTPSARSSRVRPLCTEPRCSNQLCSIDTQALVGTGQAAGVLEVGLERPWIAQLARTHVDVWCKRARVAGRLLGAACRCVKARVSRRALIGTGKVGPIRVRALAARQWRRRALRAVRARHAHVALGPAGLVHELPCAALVARGLLVQRLHGTRAARRLLGAARRCEVAHVGLGALVGAGEVGGDGVRARQAREGNRGAFGTVITLRAGRRHHRCLGTARETRWAKPCTRRA
eukprot:scaffold4571_cov72-Phaeocystis_antarctica.AAC.1